MLIQAPLLATETLADRIAPPELQAHQAAARRELERRFGRVEDSESGTCVGDRYQVDVVLSLGVQECPWSVPRSGRLCGAGSFDWWIRDLENNVELSGPELIVHLIAAHGFFEGHGSPYRVDPRALARLLRVGSRGGGIAS